MKSASRAEPRLLELVKVASVILLGALLLLWPAILNKSPFLFFDTVQYLDIGDSITSRVPILKEVLSETPQQKTHDDADPSSTASATSDDHREHPSLSYAGGRSPFYSTFVYSAARFGGLWCIIILQSFVGSFLLWTLAKNVDRVRTIRFFASTVMLVAALTSLPFYLSMAMPDVFTGLGLLSLALLLAPRSFVSFGSRATLIAISTWCAVAHTTNLAVYFIAIVTYAIGSRVIYRRRRTPLSHSYLIALLPICFACVLMVGYSISTKIVLGASPSNPPFLMARVLADGPGRAYLDDACIAPQRYALCAFRGRKFTTQDEFLWSGDPEIGVFSIVDYETRTKLKAEEMEFVLHSISQFPLWQVRASLSNFGKQLFSFGLAEFGMAKDSWDLMSFEQIVPELGAAYKNSLAYQDLFPLSLFESLQMITLAACIAWLFFRYTRQDVLASVRDGRSDDAVSHLFLGGVVMIVAVLANAAICGAVSGVNDRYEARIIWLLPLFALVSWRKLGLKSQTRDVPPSRSQSAHSARACERC